MSTGIDSDIKKVEDCWARHGLADSTIGAYRSALNHLRMIAEEQGATRIDQALFDSYVDDTLQAGLAPSVADHRLLVARWLCEALGLDPGDIGPGSRRRPPKEEQVPERFREDYLAFVGARSGAGLSEGYVSSNERAARRFLAFLDERVSSLGEIKLSHVEDFLTLMSKTQAEAALKATRTCLLAFLRHLAVERAELETVALQVSKLPMKPVPKKLQRFLTDEEATAMLRTASQTESNPKRTLLVVAMLAQYSMRAVDLRKLMIDDISWNEMTIKVGSSKSGDERVFPLTETLKYIVLDYMKNERPECDCPNLLVTVDGAPRPLADSTSITHLVKRVAAEAGVTLGYRFGAHALRRTGATTLMACGVDYPSISEHLMHASPAKGLAQATMRYLSIDIESLRGAALEVRPHAAR